MSRDVDILQIEKRVLSEREGRRRNVLLLRGMGGARKTTLLHHLGQWWQSTGFVSEVFYFDWPFDRWPEVLQTARDWGLLSVHELHGFLHLQPTFSYFLRTRLSQETQEVRRAVEVAFRQFYDGLVQRFVNPL